VDWRISALLAAVLTGWCVAAAQVKDKPKSGEAPRAASSEPDPEWLGAVERLRVLPGPGEVKAAGATASLWALYELAPEDTAKCEAIAKEYDAALLKLAAKWLEEEKALRAEHEARLVQLLPEAKRAAARKALEFSHAQWVTPTDREAGFQKEYSEKVREARAHTKLEELEAARSKVKAWVSERRARMAQREEDVLKQVKEMLGPEEAKRLDQFDRSKPAQKSDK